MNIGYAALAHRGHAVLVVFSTIGVAREALNLQFSDVKTYGRMLYLRIAASIMQDASHVQGNLDASFAAVDNSKGGAAGASPCSRRQRDTKVCSSQARLCIGATN